VGALVLLSGCEESRPMRRARLVRERAFTQSADAINNLERQRAERLGYTAQVIDQRAKRDARQSRQNVQEVQDWQQRQVKKWKAKQSEYKRAFDHELEGNPQSFEWAVPNFVY